jgi:hypothetical protein
VEKNQPWNPDWRTCALCGEQTIPRGVDWLFWRDGKPVHKRCVLLDAAKGYCQTLAYTYEGITLIWGPRT